MHLKNIFSEFSRTSWWEICDSWCWFVSFHSNCWEDCCKWFPIAGIGSHFVHICEILIHMFLLRGMWCWCYNVHLIHPHFTNHSLLKHVANNLAASKHQKCLSSSHHVLACSFPSMPTLPKYFKNELKKQSI